MQSLRVEDSGWDHDWFAVDINDYLIHCASGGGFLPEPVAVSKENLSILKKFFNTLPELLTDEEIPLTSAALSDSSSFLYYARRGFYSFDKTDLNNPEDPFYHLIARPPRATLLTNLPVDIAALVALIRFPSTVVNLPFINITTIT